MIQDDSKLNSYSIVRLQRGEYLNEIFDFECGNKILNDGLMEISKGRNIGVAYGMIDINEKVLIGYYSIATSYIVDNPLYKFREEFYGENGFFTGIPTLNLQYFAIHSNYQGQYIYDDEKFSYYLASHCVEILKSISETINIKKVSVYSTLKAIGLYYDLGFGFIDSDDERNFILYRNKRDAGVTFELKSKPIENYNKIFCGQQSEANCFQMLGNVDALGFNYE